MKQIINIILSLFVVALLASACYKDLGNYNYSKINELEISGVPADTSAQKMEILKITPKLTRSLENSEEGLQFSWKHGGEEISTERNLAYQIPSGAKAGRNDFYLTITDSKNGMKYLKSFYVNVVSPFGWGYYLLCAKEDKQTVLSYFSTKAGNTNFIHTTSVGGYEFGAEPVAMGASFGNIASLKNYYWTFSVVSQKGNNNVIITENGSFMPQTIINSTSFMYPGSQFNPSEAIKLADNSEYFVSNGQVIMYSSGLLYRPGKTPDYKWERVAGYFGYLFGFDSNTKKYYILKNQLNDPSQGLVTDKYAVDRVVPIVNQPDLTGFSVIGNNLLYGSPYQTFDYMAAGPNELKIITLKYADNAPSNVPPLFEFGECTEVKTLSVSGVNTNSKIIGIVNDWYLSAGNKIYTSPKLLPTFKEYVTLPADLGEVVAMSASAKEKYILVATYNPSATGEFKGSFVEIELSTKNMTVHKNVVDKCVKIGAFNSDPASWPFNFGDPK